MRKKLNKIFHIFKSKFRLRKASNKLLEALYNL